LSRNVKRRNNGSGVPPRNGRLHSRHGAEKIDSSSIRALILPESMSNASGATVRAKAAVAAAAPRASVLVPRHGAASTMGSQTATCSRVGV